MSSIESNHDHLLTQVSQLSKVLDGNNNQADKKVNCFGRKFLYVNNRGQLATEHAIAHLVRLGKHHILGKTEYHKELLSSAGKSFLKNAVKVLKDNQEGWTDTNKQQQIINIAKKAGLTQHEIREIISEIKNENTKSSPQKTEFKTPPLPPPLPPPLQQSTSRTEFKTPPLPPPLQQPRSIEELVQAHFSKFQETGEKEDVFQLFFSLNNELISKEETEKILNEINKQHTQLSSSVKEFIGFINSDPSMKLFARTELKPMDEMDKWEIKYPNLKNSELPLIRGLFSSVERIHSRLRALEGSIGNNPEKIIDSYAGLRLEIESIQEYIGELQLNNYPVLKNYIDAYLPFIKKLDENSQKYGIRNKIEEIKSISDQATNMYQQLISNMNQSIISGIENLNLGQEYKEKLKQVIKEEKEYIEKNFPLVDLKNKSHQSETHSKDLQNFIETSLAFLTTVKSGGMNSKEEKQATKITEVKLEKGEELAQAYFSKFQATGEKEDVFQLFFSLNSELISKEKTERVLSKINKQQTQLSSSVKEFIGFINSDPSMKLFARTELKPMDEMDKWEIKYPNLKNSELPLIKGLFSSVERIHSRLRALEGSIGNNPATIIDSYAGLRLEIESIQEYIGKLQLNNYPVLKNYIDAYLPSIKKLDECSQKYGIRNKIETLKSIADEATDMHQQLISNMNQSIIIGIENLDLSQENKDNLIQLMNEEKTSLEKNFPLVDLKNKSDTNAYIQTSLAFLTTVIGRLDGAKHS